MDTAWPYILIWIFNMKKLATKADLEKVKKETHKDVVKTMERHVQEMHHGFNHIKKHTLAFKRLAKKIKK
jgi:hypothetical protein